jgi:hypothetical protein
MAWNPANIAKSLALVRDMARRRLLETLLLAAWEEVLDLNLQVARLRGLNLKYKQQLRLGHEMSYDGRVYWMRASGGEKPDGPLCPTCWEVEDKVVHLHRVIREPDKARAHGEWREWECKRCHDVFLRPASAID